MIRLRLLVPVVPFALFLSTAPASRGVTINFDDKSETQTSVDQITLLGQLCQRFSITLLPPSDPNLPRVSADGDFRSAKEIYQILEADRRIADLDPSGLQDLLVAMASEPLMRRAAEVIRDPQTGEWVAPKVNNGNSWAVPGFSPAIRLKAGMLLLERLAQKDPAEALSCFNALAPSLAAACLTMNGPVPSTADALKNAAGDSFTFAHVQATSGGPLPSSFPQSSDADAIEPMAYLNVSGDLASFARALAVKDAALAVKWYASQRSTGLYEADQGFTQLVSDIAGRDLFEAFALVGNLAGRDQEDAATGIVAAAKNPTQWVMLVEALRQPRATAVRGVVLRSLGHDLALHLPAAALSSWYVKSGFSAEEQKLMQEGAATRRSGDPNEPVERYRFRDHRLDGWTW